MGGVDPPATGLDRGIEAILRRDRLVTFASLFVVVALSWIWLWRMAADMADGPVASTVVARAVDPVALALAFVMWVVMMAGMMLPSAAPAILLYGTLVRKHCARGGVLPRTWVFAGGYLVVWTAFSAAATVLQALLERASLLTPELASGSSALSAAALIAAGVYQLTPLKRMCLSKCTNPLQFFITRWRDGTGGAFSMGLTHGAYCVGCCWALMLLLFVAGVMNMLWIALIAAFVLAEKVFANPFVSRAASAGLIGAGLFVLARG